MKDGPNIVRIAALIGDHARADVLTALMADRALTATELSGIAGVTKQTISAHLTKLLEANLIAVEPQGRHRYYRLADHDVADLIESLMGVAFRAGSVRLKSSPREPALRRARVCYDHLAGELGVAAFEAMVKKRVFAQEDGGIALTPAGRGWFSQLGIDADANAASRRPLCRTCMDWGERRHHLAGSLGEALLSQILARGWARRVKDSRVVAFTPPGELAFSQLIQA